MNDKLLEKSYWQSLFDNAIIWIQSKGPELVILIILFLVSLQIVQMLLRRMEKIIAKRVSRNEVNLESEKRARTLLDILRGVLKVALWLLFIIFFLREIGLDIGPLLAGAGILGLAIGFGGQELVKDIISGFFMLFEDQIRTGDVAVINGTSGVVEKIELRTVTLRDMKGTVHIFQNGKINTLANKTKEWSAAVFDIGVSYNSDIQTVVKIMERVGNTLKEDADFKIKILEPIEIFGLNSFGDSALVIKARIKTMPGQQWAVMREYNKRLKTEFDKNNIEIPFPQRTVHFIGSPNPD